MSLQAPEHNPPTTQAPLLSTLIIGGEQSPRAKIKNILDRHFRQSLSLVAETDSLHNALQLIRHRKPDIILLDLQLPDGFGLDILQKLHKRIIKGKIHCIVVSNDHRAKRSFRYGAFDVLNYGEFERYFRGSLQLLVHNIHSKLPSARASKR